MGRSDGPASSPHGPGTEPSLMRDDNTKGAQYDVFLSFRGEDTRASFTSHLYSSLSNVGILVFKDDPDLPKGNSISPELTIAIERSTISIIIFSKNYAGSRWCLCELSKIMELRRARGKIVLPVFYDVHPYEVRSQNSYFGETFRDLIQRKSPREEEVSRWRIDLHVVTNIFGFVVINSRNESEEIKNIVECVCEILNKKDLFIANHPVGVNSRMQDVIKMSESHPPNDVLLHQLRKQRMGGSGSKYDEARYDVFLCFRGENTRTSFTAHLYSSLSNAGILVFKDDANHLKGLDISSELLRAIECSTMAIIIMSRDFAGSKWCLNDLSVIMKLHRAQHRAVLPVFYDVDPSDVRRQTSSSGPFGEAFEGLIKRISTTEDGVLRWRKDLNDAANLSGFDMHYYRNESDGIEDIVKHVCKILDKKGLFICKHPVGVDSRMQELIRISESHSPNHVLVLGIQGMGGIGKTVIAKAVYNEIGPKFESKTFLSNIREVWEQNGGPVCLQQKLLSEICKPTKMEIQCIDSGKNILKERLRHNQALIVLDDVDKVEQLNALSGSDKWYGPGSIIIITTRDKHLLRFLNVDADHVYTVKNMDQNESIELFSWHAFRQSSPKKGFDELSRNIVDYSGGVPLALEVLGCYLLKREMTDWKSALDKLRKIPNGQIQKKLKISFDGLNDDMEREIFLDISCFFIGMDRDDVTQILNASGFFADAGISVLIERSLITIDEKNKLGMHDLLRYMGREIIRGSPQKEIGKRSRLWSPEDVIDVLSKHTGTESVQGLALNWPQDDKVSFSTKAFKKMKTLRLLHLSNVELEGDYKYISRDLKWLDWHKFPSEYFPVNFFQKNLVILELKYSSLRGWREPLLMENLKVLNLSHSPYLVYTPDFSKLPNLEKLILKYCRSLSVIHHMIGHLDKLHLLNLKGCTRLHSLPISTYKLKNLRKLNLSGCLEFEKLEEDIEQMKSLSTLIADNTAITQVPISLVRSKSIGYISICGYQGLARDVFPSLIWSRMSPSNNPRSLISAYTIKPSLISLDTLNCSIHGPSLIYDNLPKPQSLLLECISENDDATEVNEGIVKILDSVCASSCKDLATTPNTSKILDIESSLLANHNHSQVCTSSGDKCLRHLLIHIGNNDQVTSSLSECILQGLTLRDDRDVCVLPDDKYPYWQCFKSEGASVKFTIPLVYKLKGITVCCEYYPSCDLSNMEYGSFISMSIINYTKVTNLHYRQDTMTSNEEAKWKEIISNLDSNDQVEITALFGNGFTVKRIAVYLKYYESVHEQMEDPPSSNHHRPPKVNFWQDPMNPSKWKQEHFVISLIGWGLLFYGGYKFFTRGKEKRRLGAAIHGISPGGILEKKQRKSWLAKD